MKILHDQANHFFMGNGIVCRSESTLEFSSSFYRRLRRGRTLADVVWNEYANGEIVVGRDLNRHSRVVLNQLLNEIA